MAFGNMLHVVAKAGPVRRENYNLPYYAQMTSMNECHERLTAMQSSVGALLYFRMSSKTTVKMAVLKVKVKVCVHLFLPFK